MNNRLTYRQLQSLVKISNNLNSSSMDISAVTESVMNEMIDFLENLNGAALWLHDSEKDCLVNYFAKGELYSRVFSTALKNKVSLQSGESITGLTYATKKTIIFNTDKEIKNALSSLSSEKYILLNRSFPQNYNISSVISFPIISKDDCVGVITLDSPLNETAVFTENYEFLQAISHQIAVNLNKVKNYTEMRKSVSRLSYSVKIHRDLTNLILKGEKLITIIQYIYDIISRPIFLFNEFGEVLASAYSSSITKNAEEDIKSLYKVMANASSYIITEKELKGKMYQCIIFPLGSDSSLGKLIILSEYYTDEIDIAAFEHVCTVLSFELMKEQAIFNTQQKLKGELVEQLFLGHIDEKLIHKAQNLNFKPTWNYAAMLVRIEGDQTESFKKHVIHIIHQSLNKIFSQSLAVENEDKIVVLISVSPATSSTKLMSQIKEIAISLQRDVQSKYKIEMNIGIGRAKQGLLLAHQSLEECARCLKYLESFKSNKNVISYSDLGIQRFIMQSPKDDLIDFIDEVLGPLIEYELSRKGDLMETLYVYLQTNQQARKSLEILHVHANTLSYRLKRIEEILGIDFKENNLLNVHLALLMYREIYH